MLNYCSCHGNILADSVLPPADLEEVAGTTVLGKLDWTLQSTGEEQLSIRFTAVASQEVWLATVSIVWSPHVLYL